MEKSTKEHNKKTIKFVHDGYAFTGTADVTDWYGQGGAIEMGGWEAPVLRVGLSDLNDSGFGVQSINGGIVEVWEVYKNPKTDTTVREWLTTKVIGEVSDFTEEYHGNY